MLARSCVCSSIDLRSRKSRAIARYARYGRGYRWQSGYEANSGFKTVLPPNNPFYTLTLPGNWFPDSSGGNFTAGDRLFTLSSLGSQSPFRLWGVLGSCASSENVDAEFRVLRQYFFFSERFALGRSFLANSQQAHYRSR
ncbi:MAG: hypothetical protein AAGD07_04180 [Planctomycetota bacterium]